MGNSNLFPCFIRFKRDKRRSQWVRDAFLPDGSVLERIGQVTWERSGHEWKVTMLVDVADGDKYRSEGVMDLETLIYAENYLKNSLYLDLQGMWGHSFSTRQG